MTSYKDIDLLNLDLKTNIKSPIINCYFNQKYISIIQNISDNNHNRTMDIINHIKRISKSNLIFDENNNCIIHINNDTKFFDKHLNEININKINNKENCKILFKYDEGKLHLIQCLVL